MCLTSHLLTPPAKIHPPHYHNHNHHHQLSLHTSGNYSQTWLSLMYHDNVFHYPLLHYHHNNLCTCRQIPVPLSNYTYIHVSRLNIPESPWCKMTSSDARSRLECASHCTLKQASGPCGAFIYNSTLTEPCIMYSTDSSYTEAITGEQYAQLYIAMPDWRC